MNDTSETQTTEPQQDSKASEEEIAKRKKSNRIKGLVLLIVVIAIAALIYYLTRPEDDAMGYQGDVILGDDEPVELTASDEMTLEFKNIGMSNDGKNVDCYIGNAIENQYDMWFEITDDKENVIFKSDLIKPGARLEKIELDSELDSGEHTVTITYHQMEDDHRTEHSHLSTAYTIQVSE